jgi:hypothetical protein
MSGAVKYGYYVPVASQAQRDRLPASLRNGACCGMVRIELCPQTALWLARQIEDARQGAELDRKADRLAVRMAAIRLQQNRWSARFWRLGWWFWGLMAAAQIHALALFVAEAVL